MDAGGWSVGNLTVYWVLVETSGKLEGKRGDKIIEQLIQINLQLTHSHLWIDT